MKKLMILSFLMMAVSVLVCGKVKAFNEYSIGDTITVNSEKYYVIANSDESLDYVTALKEKPLTVDEVNTYGEGRINRYTQYSHGVANNSNDYGGVSFYNTETCGIVDGQLVTSQCPTNENIYLISDIKYIVDNWADAKFKNGELKDGEDYKPRLIKISELEEQLGCSQDNIATGDQFFYCNSSPYSWTYSEDYWYWTMDKDATDGMAIWYVNTTSAIATNDSYYGTTGVVRPVINVNKKFLEGSDNPTTEKEVAEDSDNTGGENVNVENTLLNKSLLSIVIGFSIIVIGVAVYIIYKKK